MLPLFLFFIYRDEYSFSSGRKWLFYEIFFLLLEKLHSKNKQLLLPDLSLSKFFDQTFFLKYF